MLEAANYLAFEALHDGRRLTTGPTSSQRSIAAAVSPYTAVSLL
jgi:hypothetical protein